MDLEILEQIGLSKNEIKIYFTLLALEQSTATPIVKKSGIPNSKVYPTLDKLIKKGLVSYVIKNKKRYFQASDPKNLIDLLSNKERLIVQQKKEIEKLVPEIQRNRESARDKQEATIFEGLEGVKSAFNNLLSTLQKDHEYYAFSLGEELAKDDLRRFFQNYHQKRIEKKISLKLIANEDLREIFSKYHKYTAMKTRFSRQRLPTGIFIYSDCVMTVVWQGVPTAFVIKSKNNARRYNEFFEEAWKSATR